MSDIEILLEQAEHGRNIIDACTPDNQKNNVLVLFPDNDEKLLQVAYKYFDRFLADYDYAVVIALTSIDIEKLSEYTTRGFEVRRINDKDMECVLRYVSACGNALAARILSLKKPHYQRAEILNGFKDLTLDKIVCRGLYEIRGKI